MISAKWITHTLTSKMAYSILSVLISAGMASAHADPIYKVVDKASGQVTFTDSPERFDQADTRITDTGIQSAPTVSTPNQMPNQNRNQTHTNADINNSNQAPNRSAPRAPMINYQLAIVSPDEERAYQRPAQTIDIEVQTRPALQNGDQVIIYLNNQQIAQGLSASIATVDLVPGQYNIQAVIKNKSGKVINSATRSVFVIQNTAVLQRKKRLEQQIKAYNQLSWPQKIRLKLRQDGQSGTLTLSVPDTNTPTTFKSTAMQ